MCVFTLKRSESVLQISVLILKILDKDGQAEDSGKTSCVGEVRQSIFVSL